MMVVRTMVVTDMTIAVGICNGDVEDGGQCWLW